MQCSRGKNVKTEQMAVNVLRSLCTQKQSNLAKNICVKHGELLRKLVS